MEKRNALKVWMALASTEEQINMATMAGTTRGMLYQYAGGFRKCSSERAASIERATQSMHKSSKGRLPVIYRTDLSDSCKACHFAQKCLGTKAEFGLVG